MKKPELKCPYCGEEMTIHVSEVYGGLLAVGYMFCPGCWSNGPTVKASTEEAVKRIYDDVKATALRRSLQKPLTLEELHALIDSGDEVVIYIETDTHVETYANIIYGMKIFDRYGETEGVDFLRFETYGKTWRTWASRPTDEERAAAPWEE